MCAPSSSPVLASNMVFTSPSGSPSAIALPLADEGEAADLDLVALAFARASSVRPTLATCGRQ